MRYLGAVYMRQFGAFDFVSLCSTQKCFKKWTGAVVLLSVIGTLNASIDVGQCLAPLIKFNQNGKYHEI